MSYSTDEKTRAEYLKRIERLRLLDDTFMMKVFDGHIEETEFVLRIILRREDIFVTTVKAQKHLKNLTGRTAYLDVFAIDGNKKQYDIEIQRSNEGAIHKRARFNSSLMDGNAVEPGSKYSDLPETYVIFITENDTFKDKLPMHHIERVDIETGNLFNDGEHIIYVNGEYDADDDIGHLMSDFRASDPDDMYSELLKKRASYFKKDEKGVDIMCKEMEEIKAEGRAEGEKEGIIKRIKELLKTRSRSEILSLGVFSEEEINAAENA